MAIYLTRIVHHHHRLFPLSKPTTIQAHLVFSPAICQFPLSCPACHVPPVVVVCLLTVYPLFVLVMHQQRWRLAILPSSTFPVLFVPHRILSNGTSTSTFTPASAPERKQTPSTGICTLKTVYGKGESLPYCVKYGMLVWNPKEDDDIRRWRKTVLRKERVR